MTRFSIIPVFLDSPQGRIFCIQHSPYNARPHSGLVLIPPFADEMNKSRRMLTLLAEALAVHGFHVLLPDFYGTGDSEGEFSEASWSGWLEQLELCVGTMKSEHGIDDYSLLGLRSGALLVAGYLQKPRAGLAKQVFWQPVVDGGGYLNQFLRLRLASDMLAGGKDKETTQSLKQMLTGGAQIEVAGYTLTSAVTDGLSAMSLKNIELGRLPSTCWIDLVQNEGQLSPLINRKLVDSWLKAGVDLQHHACVGAPFWGSVEIAEIPDMIAKTVEFFVGDEHG